SALAWVSSQLMQSCWSEDRAPRKGTHEAQALAGHRALATRFDDRVEDIATAKSQAITGNVLAFAGEHGGERGRRNIIRTKGGVRRPHGPLFWRAPVDPLHTSESKK